MASSAGSGSSGPSSAVRLLIHGDLVDLDLGKTRDLQRHAFEDKVVQLELQLAEIPSALLAKAVNREPEKAPLGRGQMACQDAGQALEARLAGRLDPRPAVEHAAVLIDQNRRAKTKRRDRVGNLAHMGRIDRAGVPCRRQEVIDVAVDKLKLRYNVVAPRDRANCLVRLCQRLTSALAFCAKLLVQMLRTAHRSNPSVSISSKSLRFRSVSS